MRFNVEKYNAEPCRYCMMSAETLAFHEELGKRISSCHGIIFYSSEHMIGGRHKKLFFIEIDKYTGEILQRGYRWRSKNEKSLISREEIEAAFEDERRFFQICEKYGYILLD